MNFRHLNFKNLCKIFNLVDDREEKYNSSPHINKCNIMYNVPPPLQKNIKESPTEKGKLVNILVHPTESKSVLKIC